MRRISTMLFLLIIFLSGTIMSMDSEFSVSGVDISSTNWGIQSAKIGLIRLIPDYRFVVVTSAVTFPDGPTVPKRETQKVFIAEPADTSKLDQFNTSILEVPYEIPSAYGRGVIKFALYNVVDTLDALLESHKFYFKEIEFTIDTAEAYKALIDSGIQVPVFVDQTPAFDGYFNRIVALMIYRGKTPIQIAELCGVNPELVHNSAGKLVNSGYLKMVDGQYMLNFSVIDRDNLEQLIPVINSAVDELYDIIKSNLEAYDKTLNEMAGQGTLTRDPNDLLDGGSVLYHKHPTVFGLYLWDKLGRAFINDGEPFSIFKESKQIKSAMGDFMYMVEGGGEYSGETFYYYLNDSRGERMYVGIVDEPMSSEPSVQFTSDLPGGWNFGPSRQPMLYSYNPDKTEKPFTALSEGANEILNKMKARIDELYPAVEDDKKNRGPRYWCWNIIVGELIKKFEDDKIIEREGAGIYVFQKTVY